MAVYTNISDEEIFELVSEYDIGEVVFCKGIAEGVENSNFLLQTSIDNYILTIYEKRVDPKDLPFFLNLMEHLSNKGINCPKPILGRDEKALRTIKNKPCALTSFLKGVSTKKIRNKHCSMLGHAHAKLHLAGLDFGEKRKNSLCVDSFRGLFEKSRKKANSVIDGLEQEIDKELDFIENNWSDDLPKGIIHADLFPDNVFYLKDELSGIIDYYFACYDILAYDIGICLNAWCFEPDGAFNITKARKYLKEYERVRKLEKQEIEALPILARASALRFLLTRLFDWINTPKDALVTPKNPTEYFKKLKFHQAVKSEKSYGIY